MVRSFADRTFQLWLERAAELGGPVHVAQSAAEDLADSLDDGWVGVIDAQQLDERLQALAGFLCFSNC